MNNIILIGMPGSGKTTVGRRIARLNHMDFLDIDRMVVEKEGKEIPDIFKEDGESHFREVEYQCVLSAVGHNHTVIATGGGTILKEASVKALKESGTVFWLNRPLEELIPTEDRPLGNTREKVEALYHQRYTIYQQGAHEEIIAASVDEAVEKILEVWCESYSGKKP